MENQSIQQISLLKKLTNKIKQSKINKAFKREMHMYHETLADLKAIDFSRDIKYHISERSENILYLLENTNLNYVIDGELLSDLGDGLTIEQKQRFIKIFESKPNLSYHSFYGVPFEKNFKPNFEDTDLNTPQKIGTKPKGIIIEYKKY